MSKMVHYEFMGSWFLFWLLFIIGLTLPFAILYLLEGVVRTDTPGNGQQGLIVHYEFGGSWLLFWVLLIIGLTLPLAVLYLLDGIVRTDTSVDDPQAFIEAYRSGKIPGK